MASDNDLDEVWVGPTQLHWCADSHGNEGNALYIGGIIVGVVTIDPVGLPGYDAADWLVKIMTVEVGVDLSWYDSRQEARAALFIRVLDQLARPSKKVERSTTIPRSQRKAALLETALANLLYEVTHLSPLNEDGSHTCRISAEALRLAREALQTQ